ncbi:MAG: hypothetical protein JXB26_08105 [Candidatus Aminicenantes bacterium]|nr:hypothetical protein [Candidatus Aminicenantes bacterium]
MEIYQFIIPFGIATFLSLLLTAFLGLLRKKKPLFLLRWHKIQAFITIGLAAVHFLLVFVFRFSS